MNYKSRTWILLYLIPCKINLQKAYLTTRILDLFLIILYFGNVNHYEPYYKIMTNLLINSIFFGFSLMIIFKKKQLAVFNKLRILYFLFCSFLHSYSFYELIINKESLHEKFYENAQVSSDQYNIDSYYNKILIVNGLLIWIDLVHLSWFFVVKRKLNEIIP